MAAIVSPNITPRPSISVSDPHQYSGSPEAGKRDLISSPVIAASTGGARTGGAAAAASKGLPTALKPIGIINEQNTCFLNSTFQALCATQPLVALLTSSDTSSLVPAASLPRPIFPPARIPALQPDALEPPLYDLLPVTRAFINNLHRAWQMKDNGGGTYGSGETASGKCMSLRTLLREIARKYDQYDDYRQQDAHELLRHLLDSMEMEEKDIIKKIQPDQLRQPPRRANGSGGRGKSASHGRDLTGISPMPSPLPSPAHSQPGSPTKHVNFDPMLRAASASVAASAEDEWREVPENQRLVPFTDVLFGGSLASVVVCENCKSVSHTYEGFLDISLSLKDEPRTRKRDKFKALFRSNKASTKTSDAAMSDAELSDSEHPSKGARDRRKSMDHEERRSDSGTSSLSRNSSSKGFGIKAKPSFSFGKKKKDDGSRPGSSSSAMSTPAPIPAAVESERSSVTAVDSSASSLTHVPSSPASGGWKHVHGPGPMPAQAAYIQRILANQGGPEPSDPLAKLRAANNGEGLAVNNASTGLVAAPEFGLVESLRQFTSVEVLEGENSFACKKCWRIKTGKYQGLHPALREEDEDEALAHLGTGHSPVNSPLLSQRRATAPAISINSDSSLTSSDSHLGVSDERSRSGVGASRYRAPSPLRGQVSDGHSTSGADSTSISSSSQTDAAHGSLADEEGSDGLSDTSEDSDVGMPPASSFAVGRPKMPARKQSTHFVMRRAFKRYLIAKAPEVLVFHLKRFKQTQKTSLTFTSFYDLKKLDDFVSFPETLDLAAFLAPNRNDYKVSQSISGPRAPYMDWASVEQGPDLDPVLYRLYAVVVHLGTMIGGHYIAYTLVDPDKLFEDGQKAVEAMRGLDLNGNGAGVEDAEMPSLGGREERKRVWCYCSDTSIRLATLDEVLQAKAYLCFYEKVHRD